MSKKDTTTDNIKWETTVPIFRNPLILKQLGLAFGIPFGILIIILILITNEIRYLMYSLALIGFLFLFAYIIIMIIYQGNYEVGFVISNKGIRCYTQEKQAKKNKIINSSAFLLGIFLRKPGVAGAGMLAQTRQDTHINWKHIRKVTYRPKQQLILIKGHFAEQMAIFCTPDNYDQVKSIIQKKTST